MFGFRSGFMATVYHTTNSGSWFIFVQAISGFFFPPFPALVENGNNIAQFVSLRHRKTILPHLHPDLEEPPPALRGRLHRRPHFSCGFASVRTLQRLSAVGRIDPLRRLRLAQLRRPDDNRLAINPTASAMRLYSFLSLYKTVYFH